MKDDTSFVKTHRLNISTRLLLIIPSIGLIGIFSIPLFLGWGSDVTLGEAIAVLLFLISLSGFGILYAFFCRLVTTPSGIMNYSSFPFHSFVSWSDVERIEFGAFGAVNLICVSKVGAAKNRNITISTFVDDWQNSEFLQEVKRYTPQVVIPEELLNKKPVKFFYRVGTLLIYFALSMLLLFIPIVVIPSAIAEQYDLYLSNANAGFMWAVLGGMRELLWFGEWRDWEDDNKKINKVVLLFYLSPITAYSTVMALSMIAFALPISVDFVELFMNFSAFAFGFFQLQILLRVLGKFIGVTQVFRGEP